MSAVSVVLLGAGGQLGKTIVTDWKQEDEFDSAPVTGNTESLIQPAIKLKCFNRSELDICQPGQLAEKLADHSPQVIINAAAYTQVDKAESETDQAMRVNRDGAANVAEWAASNNCRLLHVSTDFVFDGKSSRPYNPEDTTNPISHYGFSKSEGERVVREILPEGSVIIRTSWLYSRYQPNFVTTMLRLMSERDQLRVVADQIGTPTSTHSLARLIALITSSDCASGVFHWSDAGVASWYDFAVAIQDEALEAGLLQTAIPIEPIKSSDYPTPASRPAFSLLDKTDSYKRFAIDTVHWRTELRRVITELSASREGK